MFCMQDQQKFFHILWAMLGNGCICISNCVLWLVSIILNFNALCDADSVQRLNYAVLLKSNRIFYRIFGITYGNYISTVSNKGEDYLWLYFLSFLNHPLMYEKTDC